MEPQLAASSEPQKRARDIRRWRKESDAQETGMDEELPGRQRDEGCCERNSQLPGEKPGCAGRRQVIHDSSPFPLLLEDKPRYPATFSCRNSNRAFPCCAGAAARHSIPL